jgi:hypothetical protein
VYENNKLVRQEEIPDDVVIAAMTDIVEHQLNPVVPAIPVVINE